jgi:hypothetical protein
VSDRSAALLSAPARPARVLTSTASALYLAVDPTHRESRPPVLPVVARGGLRLPTALTLGVEVSRTGWGVEEDSQVLVGDGAVRLPGAVVRAVRTWSPPRVPCPDAATRDAGMEALLSAVEQTALRDRAGALATGLADGQDPSDPVRELVGAGPGLTPSGDDALCGILLALRLLGPGTASMRAHLWAAVEERLGFTTGLSASLLVEASEGYAVPPLVSLCEAVVGGDRATVRSLVARVAAIGHSSGRDLLAGLAGGLLAELARCVG